jgi:hypothetical protein
MPATPDDTAATDEADDIARHVRELLDRTVAALVAADARDEALAVLQPARRVLLIMRGPAMAPAGRVWRLGVLLLSRDGRLYATGSVTRALEPKHANNQAVSAELRREIQRAAFNGPFSSGETVNYDATELALDPAALAAGSGPLSIRDGRVVVRWNSTHDDPSAIDLETYLADRVELLTLRPAD